MKACICGCENDSKNAAWVETSTSITITGQVAVTGMYNTVVCSVFFVKIFVLLMP
jgi:hypothetical protein